MQALEADEPNMRLYLVLLTECMTGNESLQALMQRHTREWVVLLEMGALKLQSRPQVLGEQAALFFTLFAGSMQQRLSGLYTVTEEHILDAILK